MNISPSHARGVSIASVVAATAVGITAPAYARGDLLIAPTRVVMNGGGAAEVILSNTGDQAATYRVEVQTRRMLPDGDIEDVADADMTAAEKAAVEMVRYAPRRITLQPNQPQTIRISARPPADLPQGEYRVHLSFKAIPDPVAVVPGSVEKEVASGLTIKLTPIYGITIPMIIRTGQLEATATLAKPRVETANGRRIFAVEIQRQGTRSVYGDLIVLPRGGGQPLYEARGVAVYPEVTKRLVTTQLSMEQAAKLRGPVRIEYREPRDTGGKLIAALDGNLN